MKRQALFAFVTALGPSLCLAAAIPKPLTITFYQKDKGSSGWADVASSDTSSIDDGKSPHDTDDAYLGHFKFDSAGGPMRKFYWDRSEGSMHCNVTISGDPKIDDLIYHLDTRTFEYQGEPDLSVVHVRCELPTPPGFDDQQESTSLMDGIEPMGPPTLTLNETDFEQPLTVIFQISEWPKPDARGTLTEQAVKDEINKDFLWTALSDKLLSDEEKAYEDSYGGFAQTDYDYLRKIADGTKSWPEYGPWPWAGEVGRMAFARSREAPRDFMWTLHNDKQIARKCHVNVNWDPHASEVYVGLTDEEPKVTLDIVEAGGPEWTLREGLGDAKAVTVTCDKAPIDDRTEPVTDSPLRRMMASP